MFQWLALAGLALAGFLFMVSIIALLVIAIVYLCKLAWQVIKYAAKVVCFGMVTFFCFFGIVSFFFVVGMLA